MKSFEKEISLSGHTSKLKKLVFTNNYLFSSSDDSYVFIWMIGDWKMVRYIEVKVAYRIVTLAVDPNEKFIVCSDEIGNLSK